jgi:hypothetical protein
MDEKIIKASLIAGLGLYGIGHDSNEAVEYARKWKIDLSKFKKTYEGLEWTYPEEMITSRLSDLYDPEDTWCMFTDVFEYTFKLNGQGFDTSEGGNLCFLSPEITRVPGPTYTYNATNWAIVEVIYDLKPGLAQRFLRAFKKEHIDGEKPESKSSSGTRERWVEPESSATCEMPVKGGGICGKPSVSHGMCQAHYADWIKVCKKKITDRDQYIELLKKRLGIRESISGVIAADVAYLNTEDSQPYPGNR